MTIIITSTPAYEEIGNGNARLLRDFHFWIDHQHYVIRCGFEWDGASIPHLLRWKYGNPFDPVHLVGGLIHDAIYANRAYEVDDESSCHDADLTRSKADAIYRATIRMHGCPWWQSVKEWFGVRVFGASHWTERDETKLVDALVGVTLVAFVVIAAAVILEGCATKTRSIELAGMYASEAGTLAIGSVDIVAAPQGEETATIKYAEDTAWLSPSTKTHSIKIMITGTNSVSCVTGIVESICEAFVAVAPTNRVEAAAN